MTKVQEIRIAAIDGLEVPEGTREGTSITVACELLVSRVNQEWVDVTVVAGEPEQLPGSVTLDCVATAWKIPPPLVTA